MFRFALSSVAAIVAAAIGFNAHAAAQCRVDKVVASAPQDFSQFGIAVAISGSRMVVGEPNYGFATGATGAAYVYELGPAGWTQQALLLASDGAPFDDFGIAVAIDGDRILVGADGVDGPQSGAVGGAYFFDWNGSQWVESQKVQANDGASGGFFGNEVALQGDAAVIGRFWDSVGAMHAGSAYVFTKNGATWFQQQKLRATNPGLEDNFGYALAISSTRIVVGAPERFDTSGSSPQLGRVFVYDRAGMTWTQSALLTASNGADHDQFGISVDIDGDELIVGAWDENFSPPISGIGKAYIYQWTDSAWSESILGANDPQVEAEFGQSVAIHGPWALVGTPSHDAFPLWGATYVFAKGASGWAQVDVLLPDPGPSLEWMGMAIAMDGDYAVIGSPIETTVGQQNGAAYVYGGFGPWQDEGHALAGIQGDPVLSGVGTLCNGTSAAVALANAKANALAALFVGNHEIDLPFMGGTLVPAPTHIVRGLHTDATGALSVDVTAFIMPPGTPTFFQAWIRDPTTPGGASASNGLSSWAP